MPLLPGVLEGGANAQGGPLAGMKQAKWFDRWAASICVQHATCCILLLPVLRQRARPLGLERSLTCAQH